jgi:tripartite tricarboxylate transporter TctB family protein
LSQKQIDLFVSPVLRRTWLSRTQIDLVVSVVVLAVITWMVWEARQWDVRARLFPLAVGIPAVGVALLQVGFAVRGLRTASGSPIVADALSGVPIVPDATAGARTRQMVAWILGITAAIVLFGFEVGSALITFAFLRYAARERIVLSLIISVITYASFLVVFDRALNIPMPPGLLTGWK